MADAFQPMAWSIVLLALFTLSHANYDHCNCEICGVKDGHKSMVFGREVEVTPKPGEPRPFPPKDNKHVRNDTKVHMLLSAFRDP
eukprot:1325718-Amorphochlora_amoeboformis.AAC.1